LHTTKATVLDTEASVSLDDARKILQGDFEKEAGSNKIYFTFDKYNLSEQSKKALL
jgi:hypothetical protein